MRSKSSDVISSVLEDDGSVSAYWMSVCTLHTLSLCMSYDNDNDNITIQVSIISKSQRPHSIDEVRSRSMGRGVDHEVMSSTGNTPLFKTVQLRQIQHLLPTPDTASICTAGSQSRVGSRRIKNANLLPLPLNEDSGGAVDSSSINDPLKLPNSRRDEVSQSVFKKSMEEMKVQYVHNLQTILFAQVMMVIDRCTMYNTINTQYKGYVKHRPLAHASHWTRQLTTFLSAVPSLEYLQKSLSQLHRASAVPLTTEEAICALSDTGYVFYYIQAKRAVALTLRRWLACLCSGSVGEVVAKLAELKFYKELQLVCRVMHVQGLVLQYVRGGDRLFHPVRTAATNRTGRRSVTVGHTSTTDYSGAKTVTFSDHFDASLTDGDHENDHRAPQDIIISRDTSSNLQFFFNGTYYRVTAVKYVLYAAYTLTWYLLF